MSAVQKRKLNFMFHFDMLYFKSESSRLKSYQYNTETPQITAFVVAIGTAGSLRQSLVNDFGGGVLQGETGCPHQTILILWADTGEPEINYFQFSFIRLIGKK